MFLNKRKKKFVQNLLRKKKVADFKSGLKSLNIYFLYFIIPSSDQLESKTKNNKWIFKEI
jgi:hypothetical protein